MSDAVEYRDIPGFPGYRVGNDGSVWSCRWSGAITTQWRVVTGSTAGKCKHFVVRLYRGAGSKATRRYTHHLVLEAFVGPRPTGMLGCHNNGNAQDNRADNLRWDTPIANRLDAKLHGTEELMGHKGESHYRAKLTESNVREIRMGYAAGQTTKKELATKYHVSESAIQAVICRRVWKHVL